MSRPDALEMQGAYGASVIVRWFEQAGVDHFFAVPGLQIDPLIQEVARSRRIRSVYATQELAAACMADGFARASGRPGVCASIGSAGALMMPMALAVAKSEDSPVIFLTGDVPESRARQGAFQDAGREGTRDLEVLRPLAKWAVRLRSTKRIGVVLRKAWGIAVDRRTGSGPVQIQIPLDVLQARAGAMPEGDDAVQPDLESSGAGDVAGDGVLVERLRRSRRPIVLAGTRCAGEFGAGVLRAFVESFEIPVATTLGAKGLLPENHRLSLGNFGFAGSRRANEALLAGDWDSLLVLGADLGERDSAGWDARLSPPGRAVLSVDWKPRPTRLPIRVDAELRADPAEALGRWMGEGKARRRLDLLAGSARERRSWARALRRTPRVHPVAEAGRPGAGVPLSRLLMLMRASLSPDTILLVDAGLHRIFAGHYWLSGRPGCFFSACALAPMGWAIAASAGVQLARPGQPVCVLAGDGCMRAAGNELATMRDLGLPILTVVCDNGAYGSVRRRASESLVRDGLLLRRVDWCGFAEALGVTARRVSTERNLVRALGEFRADRATGGRAAPWLISVPTPLEESLPGAERRSVATD